MNKQLIAMILSGVIVVSSGFVKEASATEKTTSSKMQAKTSITQEVEPNNTILTAQNINLDTTIVGKISSSSDKDYFKFTLDKKYTLNLKSFQDDYMHVDIKDNSGTDVYCEDYKNDINIDSVELNKGTYYLILSDYYYDYANYEFTITKSYFSDINNHWAYKEITDFAQRGYISGSNGLFRPNDSITRAEFVKIVNKAFGYTKKGTENFVDVSPSAWYYDEVCVAVNAGYIDANQAKFRPNDPITREEAAAIITSIKKCKDTNLDKIKTYTDYNQISSWARTSVEGAIEHGYMGQGSKTFRPKANITRAEAVVTLYRVIN